MTIADLEASGTGATLLARLRLPLVLATGLVALADWLFWGNSIGVGWPLFMLALGTAACASRFGEIRRRDLAAGIAALAFAQLPGIEALDVLSAVIGLIGTVVSILIARSRFRGGVAEGLSATREFVLRLPVGFIAESLCVTKHLERRNLLTARNLDLAAWILPVLMSVVFLVLFKTANPLIETWIESIDLEAIADAIDFARMAFWIAVIVVTWPFVSDRISVVGNRTPSPAAVAASTPAAPREGVFGQTAIVRSLVLFNILFGVQTGLDLVYLWGNVDQPTGLGYARYAHRGAYTLIVTALLAAIFVLLATRDGSANRCSKPIRFLILAWTAQNLLLVLSSMRRLRLYVEAYDLTLWRVSALIWMVLVLIGVGLIFIRILRDRPNAWLVRMNLASLAIVLYVAGCANLPYLVASYNVASVVGDPTVRSLDSNYLVELGEQAIPAIDRALYEVSGFRLGNGWSKPFQPWSLYSLHEQRIRLAAAHRQAMAGWRRWSFRGWRLQRYLDSTAYMELPMPQSF